MKEIKEKIEKIIIEEFENSKHAVVEYEGLNMIAIVKTNYKSMAKVIAKKISKLLK